MSRKANEEILSQICNLCWTHVGAICGFIMVSRKLNLVNGTSSDSAISRSISEYVRVARHYQSKLDCDMLLKFSFIGYSCVNVVERIEFKASYSST